MKVQMPISKFLLKKLNQVKLAGLLKMIPLSFKEINKIMEILKMKGFKVKRGRLIRISVIRFSIQSKIAY
jgi:hypothetical protein